VKVENEQKLSLPNDPEPTPSWENSTGVNIKAKANAKRKKKPRRRTFAMGEFTSGKQIGSEIRHREQATEQSPS